MKILITTDAYKPMVNGVVVSLLTLKQELIEKGHDVRILTMAKGKRSYKEGDVYYVASISTNKIYPNTRACSPFHFGFIKEIMDWGPDLIHTQTEFTSFLIARKLARKLRIPVVHTYHTMYEDYTGYISKRKIFGKRAVKFFCKRVFARTNAIIVPTNKAHKILENYGVKSPISVIPTGIDMDKYDKAKPKNLHKELNIPDSNKVMVFVGRLAKEKNIGEVINFFAKSSVQGVTLVIVGDGPDRKNLEGLSKQLGMSEKIKFTGMVPPEEVPAYYKGGDFFVIASQSETQGLTYFEAMASGLPQLCKSDPCIEGVVINGYNGWQYDNYDGFHSQLIKLVNDKEYLNSLSKNALEHMRKNYTAESFMGSVVKVYENTIEQ